METMLLILPCMTTIFVVVSSLTRLTILTASAVVLVPVQLWKKQRLTDGELDDMDANIVKDLPTKRDARLLCRNMQRQQPNVRHGGCGNGHGDGDGSGGDSSDGASGDNSNPVGQRNNDWEEQNHQPGAHPW